MLTAIEAVVLVVALVLRGGGSSGNFGHVDVDLLDRNFVDGAGARKSGGADDLGGNRRGRRRRGRNAADGLNGDAAAVLVAGETFKTGLVGERRHKRSAAGVGRSASGGCTRVGGAHSSVGGTVLDLDTAAEAVAGTFAVVVGQGFGNLCLAELRVGLGLDVEKWAVLDLAGLGRAGVDRRLEEVLVPARDEVAVVTVAWALLVVVIFSRSAATYQWGHRWTERTGRQHP